MSLNSHGVLRMNFRRSLPRCRSLTRIVRPTSLCPVAVSLVVSGPLGGTSGCGINGVIDALRSFPYVEPESPAAPKMPSEFRGWFQRAPVWSAPLCCAVAGADEQAVDGRCSCGWGVCRDCPGFDAADGKGGLDKYANDRRRTRAAFARRTESLRSEQQRHRGGLAAIVGVGRDFEPRGASGRPCWTVLLRRVSHEVERQVHRPRPKGSGLPRSASAFSP